MISTEDLQRKINEYIDGVENGDFANIGNIPAKYDYGHLLGIFHAVNQGRCDAELFKLFYQCIKLHSRRKLLEKSQSGEKIKVAFMVISAAEWPAEPVYRALEKDERFYPYVVNIKMTDKDQAALDRTYRLNKEFFTSGRYNYVDGVDKNGNYLGWKELGIPDICIHLSPWWENVPNNQSIAELPISCVNFYIPYGFYVANSVDYKYSVYFVYNKDFMSLMDTVFIDSAKNYEGFKKYQILQGENVVYSGYTKMDNVNPNRNYSDDDIKKLWKIPEGCDPKTTKKIIIAPHHSMGTDWAVQFSTFDKNYNFLYYLAQRKTNVSFIFKPHPNLGAIATQMSLFENYDEYLAYVDKWNSLPNAKVVEESSYVEYFETSDAMIQDSASFLAEYFYTHKPMLFLTRKGQTFNEMGKVLYEAVYKCDGRDYAGIEDFINNIVLKGEDPNCSKREAVFEENLDYNKYNGLSAGEFIYKSICSLLEG